MESVERSGSTGLLHRYFKRSFAFCNSLNSSEGHKNVMKLLHKSFRNVFFTFKDRITTCLLNDVCSGLNSPVSITYCLTVKAFIR